MLRKKLNIFVAISLCITAVSWVVPTDLDAESEGLSVHRFTYQIDRSNVPTLSFNELTLNIDLGEAVRVDVWVDGVRTFADYSSASGNLTLTTTGSEIVVEAVGLADPATAGGITKAPLLDNKLWAWSHGFDDNVNLAEPIALFDSYNIQGTLFMIANKIRDDRNVDWIEDTTHLHQHLANGWSLGNHTYDHSCSEATQSVYTENIRMGGERLQEIIDRSPRPDYKLIAFAAPCFKPWFQPIILEKRDTGEWILQFDEGGNGFLLAVQPGAVDFKPDSRLADGFHFDKRIGRASIASRTTEEVLDYFDWMSTYATESTEERFWFNTFAHGIDPERVEPILSYLDSTYGVKGTNEGWFAPSDQIYSYLLVRDRSVVTLVSAQALDEPAVFTIYLPESVKN